MYVQYAISNINRVSKHNFLGQERTIVEEKMQEIGKYYLEMSIINMLAICTIILFIFRYCLYAWYVFILVNLQCQT